MQNTENQPVTAPAMLEGTVFRPRKGNAKSSGAALQGYTLAVYAGKNKDGSGYKRGPYVDVTVVGEAASSPLPAEKDRVRVFGYLELKTFRRADASEAETLSMTVTRVERIELPARPVGQPQPQPPVSHTAVPPSFSDFDEDSPPF